MLIISWRLLAFAFLTALIEVPIFYWCGYRKKQEILAFFGANILTNLLLNEALPVCSMTTEYCCTLLFGEIMVVLTEYALLDYVTIGDQRLLKTVTFTNVVSFSSGLLLLF